MTTLDWVIVAGSIILLTVICVSLSRYMQGVADFLAANRSAGRYLLTIAGGMSGIGAISVVALLEVYADVGFPPIWWQLIHYPITLVLILSGWIYYRYRETRCLTVAQFYEARYNKATRIYAGLIVYLAGILNFGIFPAVASRFFIHFCGLGEYPINWGWIELDGMFALVMFLTLSLALFYTCLGGQITVLVTDCIQGIVTSLVFIVIAIYLLTKFGWGDISHTLLEKSQENKSMLNPYRTGEVESFNLYFYLIGFFYLFYGFMEWQGAQANRTSGLNAHEQKMGQVIGTWRMLLQTLLLVLIPICALTFMNVESYSAEATAAQAAIDSIGDQQIAKQMSVPVTLSYMLPAGLKGLFVAIMLFFLITTQDTYLHSWGSILVQDVVLPLRKKPLTPRQHVWLLRISIGFVAVFAFFFSIFYQQTDFILMFMAVTGAVVSGMGAMLIGGLYWSRGTTAGAVSALTIGWLVPVTQLVVEQIVIRMGEVPSADRGMLLEAMFWLTEQNNQYVWFFTMLSCLIVYVVVSLLTAGGRRVNLDRILHRGQYKIAGEHVEPADRVVSIWWKIIGVTKEFSRGDRLIALLTVGWNLAWFTLFVVVTLYELLYASLPTEFWRDFWYLWIWINLIIGVPVTIWMAIGGARDIGRLLRRLRTVERDVRDDGRV